MRLILFAAPREGIVIHDADAIHNAPLISMPEADACRALLAHEALVKALEAMLSLAVPGMNWTDDLGTAVLSGARSALKLAKGE